MKRRVTYSRKELAQLSLCGRDFSVIFDAYAQFEQSALAAKLEAAEDDSEGEMDDGEGGNDGVEKLAKKFLEGCWLNDDDDTDLRLARFERLFDRRPELLNSVLLRQNPHNVEQWHRSGFLYNLGSLHVSTSYLNDTDTISTCFYIKMLDCMKVIHDRNGNKERFQVTMVLIVPDWTCMLLNLSMKYQKHESLLV